MEMADELTRQCSVTEELEIPIAELLLMSESTVESFIYSVEDFTDL